MCARDKAKKDFLRLSIVSKSKPKNLKRDGMNVFSKLLFTSLFFLMGFSIIGAGLRGAPATGPIVITIGFLMVSIGVAPYIIPILYKYYVDPKIDSESSGV
ncbi:MAG: hypothetical protein ACC656_09880 [Candidatus Heimdallarchaeota archaeon]